MSGQIPGTQNSEVDDKGPILPILIRNLAAQELELEGSLSTSVNDLKFLIEEKWNIPPVCKCLIHECTEMQDGEEELGMYCSAEKQTCPLPVLELTFVYKAPYDGDIHKASLAGDRDAVRALMQARDQDKNQRVPLSLAVIIRPGLKIQQGWDGIRGALIERGYEEQVVDSCISSCINAGGHKRYTYTQVLHRLENTVGKLPDNEAFLKWWNAAPKLLKETEDTDTSKD